jgi:two-component system, OmpR family, sensor histidine kinase MtrB
MSTELESQEFSSLQVRRMAVASSARSIAVAAAGEQAIITKAGALSPAVQERFLLQDPELQGLATVIARADVRIQFGSWDEAQQLFTPLTDAEFIIDSSGVEPTAGERRDSITSGSEVVILGGTSTVGAMEITLVQPLSTRVTRIAQITSLVLIVGILALLLTIFFASLAAQRFAKPVRLLSETATRIGDGDLSARVPTGSEVAANVEMEALLSQFNRMAGRLEGTVAALRRERDRGQEHLADVSHELRTPLAALRAFVDLLDESATTDAATRKRLLTEAGNQLERMDALTANILELSRFDAGIARPHFVDGDLRSSVRAAIEQAAAGARRRGVALDERLPARRVMVRHDGTLVGQAVANLVANALKFTPRGGSVSVSVRPLATGAATITISDNGVGISAEELPRIFDRFYRGTEGLAAARKATRASGSGLGLAIVKSIVDMHAGRIVVESLIGSGTSFTLTLPADPELLADETVEPAPAPQGPASLISVGRRAAALLGEVAKTSLRLRQVLRADASSSTLEEQGTPHDAAASADGATKSPATKSTKERA